MAGAGDHRALAGTLVADPASVERLAAYLDLLAAWNERTNLTGARTAEARFDLLVRPVVPVAARLSPGTLLDIGSGNGSPGLVLAALRADIAVTLLEPRTRRWAFLREAARGMGLAVDVRRERHDEYSGPPARTVTVRALRLPAGDLAALAVPGGDVLVFGAAPPAHPDLVSAAAPAAGVHAYRRR
jgi:16S rRNA (guanine527-N7)-methyltransferase